MYTGGPIIKGDKCEPYVSHQKLNNFIDENFFLRRFVYEIIGKNNRQLHVFAWFNTRSIIKGQRTIKWSERRTKWLRSFRGMCKFPIISPTTCKLKTLAITTTNCHVFPWWQQFFTIWENVHRTFYDCRRTKKNIPLLISIVSLI